MSGSSQEELNAKLQELRGDLAQVDELWALDPQDPDVNLARNELLECIKITEDLIHKKLTEKIEARTVVAPSSSSSSSSSTVSSLTQARTTLYQVGDLVEARYSGDGAFYEAVVKRVDVQSKKYTVEFVGYGDSEALSEDLLRPRDPSSKLSPGHNKRGVNPAQYPASGPSKTAAGAIPITEAIRYDPHDTDDVKQQKKKKLKAIKSHNRFAEIETKTTSKQSSWQSFASKKGVYKRESIFKSPDSVDGRVGVVGSGKGVTDFQILDHKKVKTPAHPSFDPSSN